MYILFFILLLSSGNLFSQCRNEGGGKGVLFYVGFGTGISTFLGGDFGSRFSTRVTSPMFNNGNGYYNNRLYYNRYDYNDYYDDRTSFNPLQADMTVGIQPMKSLALELNASIRWHSYGRPDPQFETGTFNGNTYIDRYDNSTLLTVPLMASIKFYPPLSSVNNLYITAGFGFQYTSESLDRIREFYDYNSYYGDYTQGYEFPIASYSESRWYPLVKAGIGYLYRMPDNFAGSIELVYSNFFSELRNDSPLAMFRTKNVGNISLGMNIYFGL